PVISNYIESREQAGQIDTYNSSVNELSSANKQTMLNEAHEWNDNLYSKEKGPPEASGLEYENVLDLGNGVIGTVEIPKIKVNMPVYHGTG
ncbi:class C sortase, partial [[Ruminococcus] gnavus]|nr:class C sortase [Mediterraneibacter gnavus]